MFFPRLRRQAKWMFVFLAIVFGLGYVIFNVGGSIPGTGLGDVLQGLGQSSSAGPSVGESNDKIKEEFGVSAMAPMMAAAPAAGGGGAAAAPADDEKTEFTVTLTEVGGNKNFLEHFHGAWPSVTGATRLHLVSDGFLHAYHEAGKRGDGQDAPPGVPADQRGMEERAHRRGVGEEQLERDHRERAEDDPRVGE